MTSLLEQAHRNRKLLQNQIIKFPDFTIRSHMLVSFYLQKKHGPISRLDFIELCGSEQAVAEDRLYSNQSTKDFVTTSFNALSSLLVRAVLGKPSSPNLLGETLADTVNASSQTNMICCVSSSPSKYLHSLPAVKFCARIRDCIVRKLDPPSTSRTDPMMNSERSSNRGQQVSEIIERLRTTLR